jgi:hypothetical protein
MTAPSRLTPLARLADVRLDELELVLGQPDTGGVIPIVASVAGDHDLALVLFAVWLATHAVHGGIIGIDRLFAVRWDFLGCDRSGSRVSGFLRERD